jgi:hypothetical protein
MRASSSSRTSLLTVLAIAVALSPIGAQNKGTRTVVLTPYSTQIDPTAAAVAAMKARASKERVASMSDGKIGTNPVAFATCQGTKMTDMPAFRLTGADANGKAVTYDLAELDELRVSVIEDGRSQFDVTVFPAIPIATLLKQRPTYSELRDAHRPRSSAWVRTTSPGGTACLVEQVSEGHWIAFAHLGKLETGSAVTFGYQWGFERDAPVWWAIPSVARDPDYPYKKKAALKH